MSNFTQLYVHLGWSTWDRMPLITSISEPRLYTVIAAKAHEHNCDIRAIGGLDDHIHVLIQFAPTIAVSQLVGELKGASSHFVNHEFAPDLLFKWQGGYSAFTISKRSVPHVTSYILTQKARHTTGQLITALEPN